MAYGLVGQHQAVKDMSKETNYRHAYLIMAHHRPDLLRELIEVLDDPRNDIFLHIDRKSLGSMEPSSFSASKSRLRTIRSMDVNWGGYSQIKCALKLLAKARSGGKYCYYHLMTGETFPIKDQDQIHEFFRQNDGREYIQYDEPKYIERVRYIYRNNEDMKTYDPKREEFLQYQKDRGFDNFRRFGMEYRKGLAYWSISDELAAYVIKRKGLIRRMMKDSYCGDEIFMQTIAWNSPFRDRLYDENGKLNGARRVSTWPLEDNGVERENHCFIKEDLDWILAQDDLFAFKFGGDSGMELIESIRKRNEV